MLRYLVFVGMKGEYMRKFELLYGGVHSLNGLRGLKRAVEQEIENYLETVTPSNRDHTKNILINMMNNIFLNLELKMDPIYKLLDNEKIDFEEIKSSFLLSFLLYEFSDYLFENVSLDADLKSEFYLRESIVREIEPNYLTVLSFINYVAKKIDSSFCFSIQYLYRLWCDIERKYEKNKLEGFLNWSDVYACKLLNGVSVEELLENILNLDGWARAIPLEYDIDALVYAYAKLLPSDIQVTDNELILKRIRKMKQR